MSNSGEDQLAQIQRNIACPQCEYNLRGLHGEIVTCPECGAEVNVARMIAEGWKGPWYSAPGLSVLQWPVVMTVFAVLLLFMGSLIVSKTVADPTNASVLIALGWLGYFAGWGYLLFRVFRYFGEVRAVIYSVLSHFILVGYVGGIAGLFGGILSFLSMVWSAASVLELAVLTAVPVASVAVLFGCRAAERMIGEYCIRMHLRRIEGG